MNKIIIQTPMDYIDSLRGRNLKVYLMGVRVEEPVDHPMIRPSVNAMAKTYELALEAPKLATTMSPISGERVNRFLHIAASAEDVVQQNKLQRRLGQLTGTCFQRCVGMDALNALYSVTYDIDAQHGTAYHSRLKAFIKEMQLHNYAIGGAMTDVKGDRSKSPIEQADPDMYLHVSKRTEEGVYIRGAKAHQTGCINSHWLIVMPTLRLRPDEADYAIVGALPVEAEGITYVIGRQSCDTRGLEGEIEAGNAEFSGQEALIIFEDAFIPNELIFMNGEYEYSAMLVERFTAFHRRSYVCKSGVGDVLIGAAATIAEYNGVEQASHIRDKLVEMTLLNETIYATGIAASYQSRASPSGAYLCDELLANVCKQQVTRITYEMARLAQDLAGGLLVTLPSEADYRNEEIGPVLAKYLKGREAVPTENRMRILRLIENLTLGRNAVGYLTESLHGAGSPQAQRIQIQRQMKLELKQQLAKNLAGIKEVTLNAHDDHL
jgi:4-hydroxybutyryl-CoA dehydratase/vinylacetyl-CoA-Delta-isomerase